MTTLENRSITEQFLSKSTLAVGVFLTSLLVENEVAATIRERQARTDKADVVSQIRPGEFSTFVVPGYHSNGRVIGKNFDRHLEHLGTTHYAVHPEKGFSLDSIRESWLTARDKDGHRPAKIFAMSMGALLVSKLFSDELFRNEFGEVDTLVFDSGLSSKNDLGLKTKAAVIGGRMLPVTNMTSKFYNFTMRQETKRPIDHAPEVSDEEAFEHFMSSAQTPFGAGRAQLAFLWNEDASKMNLREFASEVPNKIYLASSRDSVVNTLQSAKTYSSAMDDEIVYRIDSSRADGTHASGAERPKGAVDALLNRHPDDYRIMSLREPLARSALVTHSYEELAAA